MESETEMKGVRRRGGRSESGGHGRITTWTFRPRGRSGSSVRGGKGRRRRKERGGGGGKGKGEKGDRKGEKEVRRERGRSKS